MQGALTKFKYPINTGYTEYFGTTAITNLDI